MYSKVKKLDKYGKPIIPDVMYCAKNKKFTMFPNEISHDPTISSGAVKILLILLGNKAKYWKTYKCQLVTYMLEGIDFVNSRLQELETLGFLQRIRYRDIHTNRWVGSFWAYTNEKNMFDFTEVTLFLEENGYKADFRTTETQEQTAPHPVRTKQPKKTIAKTQDQAIQHSVRTKQPEKTIAQTQKNPVKQEQEKMIIPTLEEVTEYCQSRNSKVDPVKFFEYYTENGWVVKGKPMQKWKQTVVSWEKHVKKTPTLEEITEYCKERNSKVDPQTFFNNYESIGWRKGGSLIVDWKPLLHNWEKNDMQKTQTKSTFNFDKYKKPNPDTISRKDKLIPQPGVTYKHYDKEKKQYVDMVFN